MTQIAGSVVLITGAAGGFGREMIRQLLAGGGRLVLTDLDEAAVARAVEEASPTGAAGGEVVGCIGADLADPDGCDRLHERTRELGVEVDILVNNAGLSHFGNFHEVPPERWEALMQVNLLAPMRLTHRFLPGMIERGRGHVVNISSAAGWAGTPGLVSYTASKFGLRGFGEALELDLRYHGIPVTNVYPFFSRTPIIDSDRFGSRPRPELPDDRLTDPADVVREVIDGIRDDRVHVFPDRTARRISLVKRFAPWALPYLNRRPRRATPAEGDGS